MYHHIHSAITDHINLLSFSSKPHERDLASYLQLLLDFYLNYPDLFQIACNIEDSFYSHSDYFEFDCFSYHDKQRDTSACPSCPAYQACLISTKLK